MSKEALEALKYIRLESRSAAKTSILHQLALLHRVDKGYAFPGIEYLARRCGIGRSSLIKHLNELERANPQAIIRRKNKGGRGCTTRYILPWVRTYIGYIRSLGKPPPELVVRWESTARRQRRLLIKQSEDSDCLPSTNSPNRGLKQSNHCSETVRTFGLKNKNNYQNRESRSQTTRSIGPSSIGEILESLNSDKRDSPT